MNKDLHGMNEAFTQALSEYVLWTQNVYNKRNALANFN